jgi:hypothetical protein
LVAPKLLAISVSSSKTCLGMERQRTRRLFSARRETFPAHLR